MGSPSVHRWLGAAALLCGCNALTGATELGVDEASPDGDASEALDGGARLPGSDAEAADAPPAADAGADAAADVFADATSDAPQPGPKRVFATSTTSNGDLGGLGGADAKCAQLAASAGLGGAWVAWLSTNATSAISRVTGAGPWYHVGGTSVAVTKAQLTNPPLSRAIDRDETGATVSGPVWTGTGPNGSFFDDDCVDWTSGAAAQHACTGTTAATNYDWTQNSRGDCNGLKRLYCFQQ